MTKKEVFFFFSKLNPSLRYINFSFSQEGEDVVIDRLLEHKEIGFYIDVGAHHPVRFSNTFKFYVRGWHGINVDAMPGSMKKFDKIRPRDINVEAGISDIPGTLLYYDFEEKALNTFDTDRANACIQKGYKLEQQISINTLDINSLLEKYLPKEQLVDFIDIDVEGFDDRIISSIDWYNFCPTLVLVENPQLDNSMNEVTFFPQLISAGYRMIAKTGLTCIYYRPN